MSVDGPSVSIGAEDDEPVDSELAQALESYLAAVEAGRPVDLERLAAEHPGIAEQLRSCLGVLRLAGRVEGHADANPSRAAEDRLAPDMLLGDFRMIRPIGRGGMGIVYEAEQVSLHRRVALKILPFAAALDPHQLQRFQTEAQAAAQLHHTNIVPVFSVGCERGVYYYAMQFIEGQTLAALIRDLRRLEGLEENNLAKPTATGLSLADEVVSGRLVPSPPPPPASVAAHDSAADRSSSAPQTGPVPSSTPSTRSRAFFRTVAQFGIQAAEGLDYAHRMGIVHRDIKPANLLVDVRGNLWITDFGLARMQTDSGLTLSGDVLGTLRYMSPEQALARRAIVDHRTDIYSLGTTLYEVLTLRAAFSGQDRHEVLRKIIEEEPAPLRLLNQSVPRDLETIVLKAMARDVSQRYATALDLADDLRRFLDHRPIQARRPSLWMRARKMARRHRMAVLAVASVLLILSVASALIFSQQRRNDQLQRTEQARRYVEDIHSASHLVERCRLNEASQILAQYLPKPGEEDIRSFPWFQLWKICTDQPVVLPGHSDSAAKTIYHLELSPRGDLLASSGEDGTVRLWDLDSGRLVRILRGHEGDVNWVAFSPDGLKLATGGDDLTVRVWYLSGNASSVTLGTHENWVNCVLFTPDGRKVISGARDGYVKIWDLERRQLLASFRAHGPVEFGGVEGMALSRDGRTLVTGGGDRKIKVWGTESLRKTQELGASVGSFQSVALSHDELRIAAASGDASVEVWDLARQQMVTTCRGPIAGGSGAFQCVAFSPDDRTLASCGNDGSVRLWDSVSGDLLQTYRAEETRLWCVAFSRDGRTLFSCGADGQIRRWNLARAQDRRVIVLPNVEVQSIAFSAKSDRLLLAGLSDVDGERRLSISRWDLGRGVRVEENSIELARPLSTSMLSRDGLLVCTVDDCGEAIIWDTVTGRFARKPPHRWARRGSGLNVFLFSTGSYRSRAQRTIRRVAPSGASAVIGCIPGPGASPR